MKSGTGSGSVTLFSLIKNENIILFGGTEYSNEHTTEEWKILTGITKLLTYYVNCTFGSNVMVDAIVEHHCRFCSVLMVQQDSLWYRLKWTAHFSKVSKLFVTEATGEVLFLLNFLLLRGACIILHLLGFSFPVHQVFLINILCVSTLLSSRSLKISNVYSRV